MTNQPRRKGGRYTTLAAAIILAAVVISATIFASPYPGRATATATVVSTTTMIVSSTRTATLISTTTVTARSTSTIGNITGRPGPVTLYRTNGDWNFTVILNNTAVTKGHVIAALLNLTNISGQNQTVHVGGPLYNPTVYSQNGTIIWAANPSGVNLVTNWAYGPGRSQEWDVPTSSLQSGQTYFLNVWPLIGTNTTQAISAGQYLIGEDLMINATFTVA